MEVEKIEKTRILCVISQGQGTSEKTLTGLDQNVEQRLKFAAAWSKKFQSGADVWVFGAGSVEFYGIAPTVAVECRKFLLSLLPDVKCWANERSRNYYGIFEEIRWITTTVSWGNEPENTQFIFFVQRRQLWLVKAIWRFFHQNVWGKAKFVVADHVTQIPLRQMVLSLWELWEIYQGYRKPSYLLPYFPKEFEEAFYGFGS